MSIAWQPAIKQNSAIVSDTVTVTGTIQVKAGSLVDDAVGPSKDIAATIGDTVLDAGVDNIMSAVPDVIKDIKEDVVGP